MPRIKQRWVKEHIIVMIIVVLIIGFMGFYGIYKNSTSYICSKNPDKCVLILGKNFECTELNKSIGVNIQSRTNPRVLVNCTSVVSQNANLSRKMQKADLRDFKCQ